MSLKDLRFAYENICIFFGRLRDCCIKKFHKESWGDLDSMFLGDVSDFKYMHTLSNAKMLSGFDSVSCSEFPDVKQLYLNLECYGAGINTGKGRAESVSDFIPSELFNQYVREYAEQN